MYFLRNSAHAKNVIKYVQICDKLCATVHANLKPSKIRPKFCPPPLLREGGGSSPVANPVRLVNITDHPSPPFHAVAASQALFQPPLLPSIPKRDQKLDGEGVTQPTLPTKMAKRRLRSTPRQKQSPAPSGGAAVRFILSIFQNKLS